ncbi:MAG: glycoside hydrolase family 16 protein [Candidatus Eisenbacteria bacterium]|uniref:Glycoside hydrolase family 16 protein n=1 Tax=Eiseniibacteriota bacterium TaxID=2212470 RepID=A0A849SJT0_UNCEI|nr:glycoside hydrolase family 16 protein [Candidatus Eisenbacteria bacterium]
MTRVRKRIGHVGVFVVCVFTIIAGSVACTKHPTKTQWELVWQDEFDGAVGQLPDPSRWTFDVGTDWGNGQLEYDTARPENVSLDGSGNLAIIAREEPYQSRNYTSGRINTRNRFDQAGGRFEARMRLPRGRGLWPAFWLLGSNLDTVPWPGCGEIDIMEFRGQEPSLLHGSLHGPGYSGGNAITNSYSVPGVPLDSTFHLYAVEWTSSSIAWSIDDHVYFTVVPSQIPSGAWWVFNHPFFVVLDLAVGGSFVGPPDASTVFPQRLLVDYVRVYRRD